MLHVVFAEGGRCGGLLKNQRSSVDPRKSTKPFPFQDVNPGHRRFPLFTPGPLLLHLLLHCALQQLYISDCFFFFGQRASGCFQLLKDSVFAQLHQVPTPDLSVEMLSALSAIVLAQGQESIWNKTEQGAFNYMILFLVRILCVILMSTRIVNRILAPFKILHV